MKSIFTFLGATVLAATSAAGAVGPDYQRPAIQAPIAWKNASPDSGALPRSGWWKLFHDARLDELEARALAANQDLHAAAARVEEARAAAGATRGEYFPSVAFSPSVNRSRTSQTTDNVFPVAETTTVQGTLDAAWELDLFGRIRRENESARDEAAASAADFESLRLALTAEVASGYFTLRGLDRELDYARKGVVLRRQFLKLIHVRRANGAATEFDVARAEGELASAEAEVSDLARRRAQEKNALAVLLGAAAPDFAVADDASPLPAPPAVPAGLPSALLERRPDVAAAEYALAAANARIGVAKAAFFPAISLTGSFGAASGDVNRLFDGGSRLWSIGPTLYLPLFQGGRIRANLARSRAAYDENVARYRQRLLVAFREVQDSLTASRLLADQAGAEQRAVTSATRAEQLAQTQFDAGYVSTFEVIDAQRTLLATERVATQVEARRLINSVGLIKALGGGWSRSTLVASTH